MPPAATESHPATGSSPAAPPPLTRSSLVLLVVLAAMNFCHILDFMIMMPLGPMFMRIFSIDARRFGFLVSAYTFSAAIAGFAGAFVIDAFGRKKALVFTFTGFMLGTLACAVAPTYELLLAARVVAGAFGGVVGALVFAVIGDAIPAARRGQATGLVMGAFSLASIAGIPLGLYLATAFEWHAPFYAIVIVSGLALALALKVMPPLEGHLAKHRGSTPWQDVRTVVGEPVHRFAFLLVCLMMLGGFSVIPFISAYLVANVDVPEGSLSYVYLCGGAATLVTSPFFGRMADRYGNHRVFGILVAISIVPLLGLTNLPPVPLWAALAVTTVFMVFISGRMVVGVNMINSAVLPAYRGSFMSINSSIQQMSAGLASFVASLIVTQAPGTSMKGYATVGAIAALSSAAALLVASRVKRNASLGATAPAGGAMPGGADVQAAAEATKA